MKRIHVVLAVVLFMVAAACSSSQTQNSPQQPAPPSTPPAPIVPIALTGYPRFCYGVNYNDNSVSTYAVDANSGRLRPISTIATGVNPISIAIDPSYRYVYVTNTSNDISQYTINPDGTLSAMTPSTVPAGIFPNAITVDPSGRYVYVTNVTEATVSQYTIGQMERSLP